MAENEPAAMRTHQRAISVGYDYLQGIEPENNFGLKGISCMVAFKHFDLATSFPIDYMHGTLLGVVKLLLDIWLGGKKLAYSEHEKYKFKPLTPTQRLELNRRIIALKPPTRFRHKPRSILDRAFCTANEYKCLLWYYIKFTMYGLINKELIKHFALLSDATYILSTDHISRDDISSADSMLNQFANQFQYYYGENAVTINVHNLRHYAFSVMNTGPLWSQSMFAFEANIGEIKRSFKGTVDVVEQIAFNYAIRSGKEFNLDTGAISPEILRLKSKELNVNQLKSLEIAGMRIGNNQQQNIGYEMQWRRQVYKSISSITTKSVDHFVQMIDGIIGSVEFYIQFEKPYLILKCYEVIKNHKHLNQIRKPINEAYRMYACDSIKHKLIYLKFAYSGVSYIEIATLEPNHYESS